jgi:HTH-type transcriptional regulator, competence development regulator
MAFGDMVRARRTELKIGLNEMAERLGISPGYWSRIERNLDSPPSDEVVERTAAILGIQLDTLFVEAQRLPPDMRRDIGQVVLAYRRMRHLRMGPR